MMWMLEKTLSMKRQEKRNSVKTQNDYLLEEKRTEMFNRQQALDFKLTQRNQVGKVYRMRVSIYALSLWNKKERCKAIRNI